jgi:hypothetical protein
MAAVHPTTGQSWYYFSSDWRQFTDADVDLSADRKSLVLTVTDAQGNQLRTTIDATNASRVQFLGEENGYHLMRIAGTRSAYNLQPVPQGTTQQAALAPQESVATVMPNGSTTDSPIVVQHVDASTDAAGEASVSDEDVVSQADTNRGDAIDNEPAATLVVHSAVAEMPAEAEPSPGATALTASVKYYDDLCPIVPLDLDGEPHDPAPSAELDDLELNVLAPAAPLTVVSTNDVVLPGDPELTGVAEDELPPSDGQLVDTVLTEAMDRALSDSSFNDLNDAALAERICAGADHEDEGLPLAVDAVMQTGI